MLVPVMPVVPVVVVMAVVAMVMEVPGAFLGSPAAAAFSFREGAGWHGHGDGCYQGKQY